MITSPVRNSEQTPDFTSKLIILGNSGVGKTSILMRLTQNIYTQNFITTIGMDYKTKIIRTPDRTVKLLIWDTAGQQKYKVITKSFYNGVSGIVLVYSINDRSSFEDIRKWIKQIGENVKEDFKLMILGNKCDMKVRVVEREEGERVAEEHGGKFMEVSAKKGEGVEDAFESLAGELRARKAESIMLTSGSSQIEVKRKSKSKEGCC